MTGEAIVSVSAAVVALAQIAKWYGVPDGKGPIIVVVLSLIGVVMWAFSQPVMFDRTLTFTYFSGWVAVTTSAAGVFGFTRAAATAITGTKTPPTGAGASPTVKE